MTAIQTAVLTNSQLSLAIVIQYHPEEYATLLRVVSVSKLAGGITATCETAEL